MEPSQPPTVASAGRRAEGREAAAPLARDQASLGPVPALWAGSGRGSGGVGGEGAGPGAVGVDLLQVRTGCQLGGSLDWF